jgi:hypothetical protein
VALPLSDPKSRAPIAHDTLLVVEGRDAFGFSLGLLTELKLEQRIEIRNAGGVDDLPDFLLALSAVSGFGAVRSLGVVQDSEADPAVAFAGVCGAIRGANLPIPAGPLQPTSPPPGPRVTVTLLPDPKTPGMLETLCWQALGGDPRVPCIDEYLNCIGKQTGQPVQRPEKSRVYAYISAREEPWLLLGTAARAGYFPWASSTFDAIKLFLQGLIAP